MEAASSPNTFTHILVGDVVESHRRVLEEDSALHRRALVRAVSAAVEGLLWRLKQEVQRHARVVVELTIHERAALLEETYIVDERGQVKSQPRYMPLTSAIRLVVSVVQRYRPEYKVDFNHAGWANLRIAIQVRNRLVHPKALEDLVVTDGEVKSCMSAFSWMLALVIEVLFETTENLEKLSIERALASGKTADNAKDR